MQCMHVALSRQIRHNIVHNGLNCPAKFPCGEKILAVIPQMLTDPTALDKHGMPISFLATTFSIKKFVEAVTTEEYRTFIMHALEYQNVLCEQLGNGIEKGRLEEDPTSEEPYGVILQAVNIRDLSGLGMEHCGPKGQEISKMMTVMARDNYPEMLRKMIIVNSPWVFNGLWWVLKALLPQRTIDKVSINGSSYADALAEEVELSSLPESLGGTLTSNGNATPFEFDTSEGGLLWMSPESS
jgi:hypothetical protein